jgi:hypothetical protein
MGKWLRRAAGWVWVNLGNIAQIATWIGGFALTAWAAAAAKLFEQYAPFSYVMAGLLGSLVVAFGYWLVTIGRARWIRTKYDNVMMQRGGLVDPLAKTFEAKRIYLSEFVMPSHPWVEGKTFIDCEIIGPANVTLVKGNSINDGRLPSCDAVALSSEDRPYNVIYLNQCTFRGCSFVRITFFVSEDEYDYAKRIDWLHWIGHRPTGQRDLPLTTQSGIPSLPVPQDTEPETTR